MKKHAYAYAKAPLDIINKQGNVILALFTASNKNDMQSTSTIAMRVVSADFIRMIQLLRTLDY
jgi:hypothetical protein